MLNKKHFLFFLLLTSVNILACHASNLFGDESGLRHRKYRQVPTYKLEINSDSTSKSSNATYEDIFQSEAITEFLNFCIQKKINCNLNSILNYLKLELDDQEGYNQKENQYKRFLANYYHVPQYLLNDLYADLVRMILAQRKDKDIHETTEETTDSE